MPYTPPYIPSQAAVKAAEKLYTDLSRRGIKLSSDKQEILEVFTLALDEFRSRPSSFDRKQ